MRCFLYILSLIAEEKVCKLTQFRRNTSTSYPVAQRGGGTPCIYVNKHTHLEGQLCIALFVLISSLGQREQTLVKPVINRFYRQRRPLWLSEESNVPVQMHKQTFCHSTFVILKISFSLYVGPSHVI